MWVISISISVSTYLPGIYGNASCQEVWPIRWQDKTFCDTATLTWIHYTHHFCVSTDMNVHVWYTTALQFYILMISFDPSISWFSFLCFIVSIWPHLPSPGIDHTGPLFGKMVDLEPMGRHLTFLGCFAWCYLRGIKSLVPLRDSVMSWWIPMFFPEKQKAKQKAAVLARFWNLSLPEGCVCNKNLKITRHRSMRLGSKWKAKPP